MNLRERMRGLFGRKASQLTYDQIANLIDGSSSASVAGVTVTAQSALKVSTVLACVKVIADGCATPPLHVYRETADGTRQLASNIPEYRLLSRRPNEWQTSFEWRRLMTMHAALTGTGLSLKVRGDNRRIRELIPIMPGRWDVREVSRYDVRYRLWDDFGMIGEVGPDDVFVLPNLQWSHIKALDAVTLTSAAVGLAMATERTHAQFHANGIKASGVYSVEGNLSTEQYDRLRGLLKNYYQGAANAGLPFIVDRSATWQQTSMSGVDAQHVETRRLQIEEICRAYGVFPIMVGHSDKTATFASSESFFAAHLVHTLAPWHQAWTQRIDEMLLDGAGPLFAEFDTRYMRSGSLKDRAQWARTMAEMGIYTRNELRDEEGKDPLPGLDEPLTPMNMGGGQTDNAPTDGAKAATVAEVRAAISEATQRTVAPQIIVKADEIERHVGEALRAVSQAHVEHMKAVATEMPITINVPPAAPPDVNVTVQPAAVNVEAVMPSPTVVVNGPSSSTQTVTRDADGDIASTTTTYTYEAS